jgi:hypothetical protein
MNDLKAGEEAAFHRSQLGMIVAFSVYHGKIPATSKISM